VIVPEKRLILPSQVELIEKASRFIGLGYPCLSIDYFMVLQDTVRQCYRDASHVTFAYRIKDAAGFHIKCSDAGEPPGTAGRPILSHIEGRDLINTAVFVVRYFGGTKLGAGGLARAYGNAAKTALEQGKIQNVVPTDICQLTIAYERRQHLDYQFSQLAGEIISIEYREAVQVKLQVPSANRSLLFEKLDLSDPIS